MDLQLFGRVFVVTGGSAGLGFATARVLVEEGARVLLCGRDQRRLDRAVEALGDAAAGHAADLVVPGTAPALVEAARSRFGRLDGAFVSHGGPPAGSATALDDEALRRSLEVALVAPVRVAREVVRHLEPGGSVVVLTSSSTDQPIPGLAGSNVARPGVWGYVRTLADEVAPQGIRVNALLPGRFATERVAELEAHVAGRTGRTSAEVRAEFEEHLPLGRIGEPEEFGRVAAFLLSPAASYVAGTAWRVDGGLVRGL